MRFFMLLAAVAFAEGEGEAEQATQNDGLAEQAAEVVGAVTGGMDFTNVLAMFPDQDDLEEYGITKENGKKVIDCLTKFGKDVADKIQEEGLEAVTKMGEDIQKEMEGKDPLEAGKAMFDMITESCDEKTLLEKIYYKMKSGEYAEQALAATKKAKDYFAGKAADFGDMLKTAGDKGKALFDKIFTDGEKVNLDELKKVAVTIKTKEDGSWEDKDDQPEDVQLLMENGIIAEGDGATDEIAAAGRLEAQVAQADEEVATIEAADASPAFMAAAGVAFISLLL